MSGMKVLVVMEDDRIVPGHAGGVEAGGEQEQTRDVLVQLVAMQGVRVRAAKSAGQLARILRRVGDEIGTALVVEQGAGNANCLRFIEMIREAQGERIKIIGVAQTVECMERMEALRVQRLIGAPLGYINVDEVLDAIREGVEI